METDSIANKKPKLLNNSLTTNDKNLVEPQTAKNITTLPIIHDKKMSINSMQTPSAIA